MKRYLLTIFALLLTIALTVFGSIIFFDTRASLRAKDNWAKIRVLQSCTNDYYIRHKVLPYSMPELLKWGNENGYSLNGVQEKYVRISNDACAFLDISYGAGAIVSFKNFSNGWCRDFESKSNGRVIDREWNDKNHNDKGA